jgi:hypothetical protein
MVKHIMHHERAAFPIQYREPQDIFQTGLQFLGIKQKMMKLDYNTQIANEINTLYHSCEPTAHHGKDK